MKTVQIVAPVLLPVSLDEIKMHLRLSSGSFDSNLTLTQCLSYGAKGISAGGAYTHVGTGVDVLGKQADVIVHHGTNGDTGTVDTKIQEADVLTGPYNDWTGGAFAQVTTANDNADYKKQYTGSKQFIRTASKVLLAACEFGTSVLVNEATTAEDDLLLEKLQSAIEDAEDFTGRQLLTATYNGYLCYFPTKDYIELPFGNLQSVTSITYKDTDGTETTMIEGTDYLVETNVDAVRGGDQVGRIVLPYGVSWPAVTLYPSNPITIEFVCGWKAADYVPSKIKQAIMLMVADRYADRGEPIIGTLVSAESRSTRAVHNLLYAHKLWSFAC